MRAGVGGDAVLLQLAMISVVSSASRKATRRIISPLDSTGNRRSETVQGNRIKEPWFQQLSRVNLGTFGAHKIIVPRVLQAEKNELVLLCVVRKRGGETGSRFFWSITLWDTTPPRNPSSPRKRRASLKDVEETD